MVPILLTSFRSRLFIIRYPSKEGTSLPQPLQYIPRPQNTGWARIHFYFIPWLFGYLQGNGDFTRVNRAMLLTPPCSGACLYPNKCIVKTQTKTANWWTKILHFVKRKCTKINPLFKWCWDCENFGPSKLKTCSWFQTSSPRERPFRVPTSIPASHFSCQGACF